MPYLLPALQQSSFFPSSFSSPLYHCSLHASFLRFPDISFFPHFLCYFLLFQSSVTFLCTSSFPRCSSCLVFCMSPCFIHSFLYNCRFFWICTQFDLHVNDGAEEGMKGSQRLCDHNNLRYELLLARVTSSCHHHIEYSSLETLLMFYSICCNS